MVVACMVLLLSTVGRQRPGAALGRSATGARKPMLAHGCARCSGDRWSAWEGRTTRLSRGPSDGCGGARKIQTGDANEKRRLRGLRAGRREMLTERAIRAMSSDAILRGRRLDVRVRSRTHRVALETRVRDRHEARQHELHQRGNTPHGADQAGLSSHDQYTIESNR